jgi:hypothetical protein
MSRYGYKATRWGGPSHVRLRLTKRTILLTAAAHNDLFVGNVRFAIRKRTFASVNLNDRCGSIPVIQCGLQASHWKALYLRPRYLTFVT